MNGQLRDGTGAVPYNTDTDDPVPSRMNHVASPTDNHRGLSLHEKDIIAP